MTRGKVGGGLVLVEQPLSMGLTAARRLMHAGGGGGGGALSNLIVGRIGGAAAAAPAPAAARVTTAAPASIASQVRGLKTYKIKPYSSWKGRFQITSKGKFIRKQKGKRHKSFGKSPKQRMRLRATKLVHSSLTGPMKKLGFKLR